MATAVAGPGRVPVMNANINFDFYQNILKKSIWPSVHGLKLKSTWVLLQDNDLKRTSGSTPEWLIKNKIKGFGATEPAPGRNSN